MLVRSAPHNCFEHAVHLDPCPACSAAGIDCPLSTQGVCAVCGELIMP